VRSLFNKVLLEIARRTSDLHVLATSASARSRLRRALPRQYFNVGCRAEHDRRGLRGRHGRQHRHHYSIANFPRCAAWSRSATTCATTRPTSNRDHRRGLAYGAWGCPTSPRGPGHHAALRTWWCWPRRTSRGGGGHARHDRPDGPVYYRCGYKKEPPLHAGPIEFRIGRAIQVGTGKT